MAEADAEVAYARVGTLCEAIKAELNNDLKIHDAAILPQFINLPQVTAGEYCRVRNLSLALGLSNIDLMVVGKILVRNWCQAELFLVQATTSSLSFAYTGTAEL